MKVISSQKYIDFDIVDEKINEIKDESFVTLPVVDAEMKDKDGNDLYILVDGHHTMEAAEELGIEIRFEEISNEYGLTGSDLLLHCYMDSDWYYVDTKKNVW